MRWYNTNISTMLEKQLSGCKSNRDVQLLSVSWASQRFLQLNVGTSNTKCLRHSCFMAGSVGDHLARRQGRRCRPHHGTSCAEHLPSRPIRNTGRDATYNTTVPHPPFRQEYYQRWTLCGTIFGPYLRHVLGCINMHVCQSIINTLKCIMSGLFSPKFFRPLLK